MKAFYDKLISTLKTEGLNAVFKKAKMRTVYNYLRFKYRKRTYQEDWNTLKNRFSNERVFLLGNGPSLNKTPLYLLKNEYTMCFNRFYIMSERLNWNPFFYLSVDNLVLNDLLEELDEILPKFKYVFFPDIHFRGVKYFNKIGDYDNLYWIKQKFGPGFSTDLPSVYPGGSVIYEGFQILNYLGFKEIYFVGVDMNFKIHDTAKEIKGNHTDIISQDDDDPNHFDPRYFGKGRKYHQPEDYVVANIFKNLRRLSTHMKEYDLEIVNAGIDSEVECFPKIKFEELFNFNEEEKITLINECFERNTEFSSVKEFSEKSEFFESNSQLSGNKGHFRIPVEDAVQIINDYIFTHIPIGPHNGMYYFVSRD